MEKFTKEQFQEGQVLLIDKPLTWSSFQAVNKLKYALIRNLDLPKRFKIGHAGTLDPLATGLLIVCTGKFTKRITELQGLPKEYTGTITVGATTPSYDLETAIDQTFPIEHINPELIHQVKEQFIGQIEQFPPIFPLIRKNGKGFNKLERAAEEFKFKSEKFEFTILKLTELKLQEIIFGEFVAKA